MSRFALVLFGLVVAVTSAHAQAASQPQCARPDTIIVRGNHRVAAATILGNAGLNATGDTLNFRIAQRAIKNVFATGQFNDVRLTCELSTGRRSALVLTVAERPILKGIDVTGTRVVSDGTVRSHIDVPVGKPLDPAKLARATERIDSLYAARGYYLAKIAVDSAPSDGEMRLTFKIDEGRRLAISGVNIVGNTKVSDAEVVTAMKTKPEGFWWWRKGAFDQDKFSTDLGDRIPKLYQSKGFIDFQIAKDTLLVIGPGGRASCRSR